MNENTIENVEAAMASPRACFSTHPRGSGTSIPHAFILEIVGFFRNYDGLPVNKAL